MPTPKLCSSPIALSLLILAVVGCKQLQRVAPPTKLTSRDGRFELTLPAGWRTTSSLNDQANIQASFPLDHLYVIVLSEPKVDYNEDVTLDKFTEISIKRMRSTGTDIDSTPPLKMKVNGRDGRQYLLQRTIESLKLSYLITTVETADHYHQIISWTLRSRISENQMTMQKVTESFREIAPTKVESGEPLR